MPFEFGHVYTLKSAVTKDGLTRDARTGQFKARPGTLDAVLYLGPLQHGVEFSPDGALAALGYGPILFTRATRALIDALIVAREEVVDLADGRNIEQPLAQIDAALKAVGAFRVATDVEA